MKNGKALIVGAIGHFLVDFACATFLLRHNGETIWWMELLIFYNFCAFALQMPMGILVDRWPAFPWEAWGMVLCGGGGATPQIRASGRHVGTGKEARKHGNV